MRTKILFLTPARLGDTLMLTPALTRLKKLHPNSKIDILADSHLSATVFDNNPYCDQIFCVSKIKRLDSFAEPYQFLVAAHNNKKIMQTITQLNKPVMLIEQADQSQAQAKQALEFIDQMQITLESTIRPVTESDHQYQIYSQPSDINYTNNLIPTDHPYVVIHLGCHGLNKHKRWLFWIKKNEHDKVWPVEHFVSLAKLLSQTYPSLVFVLTGSANERKLASNFIAEVPNSLDCTGNTSVQQLALLIKSSALFISGDTGSMHVACTTQTPLIALFANTNSVRTGPYPPEPFRKVVQADRIENISPEHVYKLAIELLANQINDR